MNTSRRQRGMSIPGILAIMLMVGFFLMCAIRILPPYTEYLSVNDIISRMAMEPGLEDLSGRQIHRKIDNIFNSNQIYKLDPRDVKIYRRKGKTYIDANYEVRLPILWRIDAVLKFDDLLYMVGAPKPVTAMPAASE